MCLQPHVTTLPAGVVLPSDARAAREVLDEAIELARQEQAAQEFCEKLEQEKNFVDDPEFAI